MAPIASNTFIDFRGSRRTEQGAMRLEAQLERAIPLRERLEDLRGWRNRLSPKIRRIYSSGQLLFQVIGIAGYAGYFAGMHTLMRICSGALVAGTWYAIYRMKVAQAQFDTLSDTVPGNLP